MIKRGRIRGRRPASWIKANNRTSTFEDNGRGAFCSQFPFARSHSGGVRRFHWHEMIHLLCPRFKDRQCSVNPPFPNTSLALVPYSNLYSFRYRLPQPFIWHIRPIPCHHNINKGIRRTRRYLISNTPKLHGRNCPRRDRRVWFRNPPCQLTSIPLVADTKSAVLANWAVWKYSQQFLPSLVR